MLFIIPNIQANYGRKSKVHFDFFRPEYSGTSGGGPLILVGILPTEIRRSIFDKPVHGPTFLHLCRKFGKKNKNGKSYSSWLARFDRKMSFHFLRVFLALVSDRSTSHNGKHQSSASANQIAAFALDH